MKTSRKGISERIISTILSIIMLVCFVVPGLNMTVYAQDEATDVTTLCETKVEVINSWEGGYQAQVVITNNITTKRTAIQIIIPIIIISSFY